MTATEKRLQAIKKKRSKAEDIVLAALTRAVNEGLKLEDHLEVQYVASCYHLWYNSSIIDRNIERGNVKDRKTNNGA